MPLLNALRIGGDDARAALEPGESLLALSPATVAYGVTEGPRGTEPDVDAIHDKVRRGATEFDRTISRLEGKNRPRRGLVRVLLAPFALFGAGPTLDPGNFPESWLGGRTCEGPAGSSAREVQQSVKNAPDCSFAVTDQRILVLDRTKSGSAMTVLWALPRTAVTSARHRPRPLARGRFELRFTDGSRIVLSGWPPNVGSWHAKKVVAALAR